MENAPRLSRFENAILRVVDGPKRALATLAFVLAVMPLSNGMLLIQALIERLVQLA